MRYLTIILLFMLLPASAAAQTSVLGFGRISCGTWLESATNEGRGTEWLMGFWTGGNALGADTASVGSSVDAEDLIEDAKNRCRASETSRLIEIATEMFGDYRVTGQ